MIKAIIFDLDGTLIDSETFYVDGTREWLLRCGINIDFKTASGIIGKTMEETYDYLSKLSGIDVKEIIKKNTEYFTIINPLVFSEVVFEDVKENLKQLKKNGLKICICSMSPRDYIKEFIEECSLNEYIDYYLSGDECNNTKPDPEIYNKTISELGLSPKEVLVVEDAPSGLQAAKASGAYVVARNDAKFGLNQEDALYILEDLSELSTIIMEINNGKYD